MSYTHFPTRLKSAKPDADHSVRFKGGLIGRVRLNTTQSSGGQWHYHAFWQSERPNSGICEDLEDGLKTIKRLHIADDQPPPIEDLSPSKRLGYKYKRAL